MAHQAKTSRCRIEGTNQSSIKRSAVGSNRVCFCTLLLHFDLRDMYCDEGEETSLECSANEAHYGTATFDADKPKKQISSECPYNNFLALPADQRAVAQELECRLLASEVRFRKLQSSQEPGHRTDQGLAQ